MKHRISSTGFSTSFFILNCLLLFALILGSCAGLPVSVLGTPTPAIPTPTSFQQSLPPALVETDPPLGSMIGDYSPITFYFNQAVNKSSVENALSGLPDGTFTWKDEATLTFTPTQPYPTNTTLNFSIANSIQSVNGFGIPAPIDLSFTVADYLRPTNVLPKSGAEDVNVDAAIAVSFNQPVVALGDDSAVQPSAFYHSTFRGGTRRMDQYQHLCLLSGTIRWREAWNIPSA